jgi:molybdopterin molybdotransferase
MTEKSMPENLSLPDPRRRDFSERSSVDEGVAWIDRRVETLGPQDLGLGDAAGRVLAAENPVSCLCAYDLFAGRIIRKLGGRSVDWPYRAIERSLARKLASSLGRLDYVRVRVVGEKVEPMAIGGASILSSTTRADGFVLVPADLEGYPAAATVTVWLYDL